MKPGRKKHNHKWVYWHRTNSPLRSCVYRCDVEGCSATKTVHKIATRWRHVTVYKNKGKRRRFERSR